MADFLIFDDNHKENKDNTTRSSGSKQSGMDKLNALVYSFQKVKTSDKVIFYRLLSVMVNAGVPLLKAVNILKDQEKNPLLKQILDRFSLELKE
ncbi:MAG: type II secretion system F family protein [Candidatus Peribacteria bacterium]|jgi:type IV pilus assembly protein PilC|nr:type II secretion system F family protein [Candidatus Peribacteria bacterium]